MVMVVYIFAPGEICYTLFRIPRQAVRYICSPSEVGQPKSPSPFPFPFLFPCPLYRHALAVVGTPDATDALVYTRDGLVDPLDLVPAGVAEQLRLLQDLQRVHVLDADGLLVAVDVVADEDGVFPRSGRDDEFDLGIQRREPAELGLDEGAGGGSSTVSRLFCSLRNRSLLEIRKDGLLHASRASSLVAVVDVHLPALQDEGADAILTTQTRC